MNRLSKISGTWYFLGGIILIYFYLFLFNSVAFTLSIKSFWDIALRIVPTFFLVFIIMSLTNYFITPKFITKHFTDSKFKKWSFIVIGGILSSGPIYMWYPLLAEFKNKGLNDGLIACFLYNRAIKITLLPIAVLYFGWKYVIALFFVMIIASLIQGILINKLMEIKQ